jgi:hypothetical protein
MNEFAARACSFLMNEIAPRAKKAGKPLATIPPQLARLMVLAEIAGMADRHSNRAFLDDVFAGRVHP